MAAPIAKLLLKPNMRASSFRLGGAESGLSPIDFSVTANPMAATVNTTDRMACFLIMIQAQLRGARQRVPSGGLSEDVFLSGF